MFVKVVLVFESQESFKTEINCQIESDLLTHPIVLNKIVSLYMDETFT